MVTDSNITDETRDATAEQAAVRDIDWEQPISDQLSEWGERIQAFVQRDEVQSAIDDLNKMRPIDRAELIHTLNAETRAAVFEAVNDNAVAEVLDLLDPDDANEAATSVKPDRLANILEITPADTAVDILRGMEWETASLLLSKMKSSRLLGDLYLYDDAAAGGVMTPDIVALSESWNIAYAINFLRSSTTHPEHVRQLFVIDSERKLTGWVELSELIFASPRQRVRDIMHADALSVKPEDEHKTAAAIAQRYGLLSVPVVNERQELQGAIPAREIQRIIEETTTEDFLRLSGAGGGGGGGYRAPIKQTLAARLPWLTVNIFAAAIVGVAISLFEGAIAAFAVLTSHLAMIMSQSSVMGQQVNIVTIRALAVGDISYRSALPLLAREYALASVNGVVIAGIMALVVGLWRGNFYLGLVMFVATFAAALVSVTAAAIIPLVMQRVKVDPANSSGTILSTVSDLASSLIYLGLATLLLSLLLPPEMAATQ